MNKYAYTLQKEIETLLDEDLSVTIDTKIIDIFSEDFNEICWNHILIKLELIYGFNIPDSLADNTALTISEFGMKLSKLPIIPSVLYPDFHELKTDMIEAIVRLYSIKTGLEEGSEEEVKVINDCLDLIEESLKYISPSSLN